MIASVRAAAKSPLPMVDWVATIVELLVIAALPYFLGLVVRLPMLGRTT